MTVADKVAVFNNTNRIITLKGQTPKKNKDREVKRFKSVLYPKVLNLVPKAFLAIYKRNRVTQALFDEEQLIMNKPKSAGRPAKPQPTAAEVQEAAALKALEDSENDNDED
jgi:hypothetical protein